MASLLAVNFKYKMLIVQTAQAWLFAPPVFSTDGVLKIEVKNLFISLRVV